MATLPTARVNVTQLQLPKNTLQASQDSSVSLSVVLRLLLALIMAKSLP